MISNLDKMVTNVKDFKKHLIVDPPKNNSSQTKKLPKNEN